MKLSFRKFIIFFILILYFSIALVFIIFYQKVYTDNINKIFSTENKYSNIRALEILNEEKTREKENSKLISKDALIYAAYKDNLYLWGAKRSGDKIIAKKMNKWRYLNLANKIKADKLGNREEIILLNKNLEIEAFSGNINEDIISERDRKLYKEILGDELSPPSPPISYFELIDGQLYIKAIANISEGIKPLGLIVLIKKVDLEFIRKMKKYVNREIIIGDGKNINSSTLNLENYELNQGEDRKEVKIIVNKKDEYSFTTLPINDFYGEEIAYLGVGKDIKQLNSILRKGKISIIAVWLMLTVIIGVFLLIILNIIFRSFKRTVDYIKELEKVDYNLFVEDEIWNELNSFKKAINHLIKRLKRRERQLEANNEELEELNEKLEEIIYERTKKLEDALKAKDMFLANVSHEIKTPLNGLIGAVQLLNYSNITGDVKEKADLIKSSSESLLLILNNILDYSKLKSNNIVLKNMKVSIRELLENTVNTFTASARKKKIYLLSYISKKVPETVYLDTVKFQQVLMNLLSNAIKFTESGAVTLICDNVAEYEDKVLIKIAVKDTGIGIDEEQLDGIFQEFNQGDISYKKEYEGTGLGLSISQKIVGLMGGKISVESIKSRGSIFSFEILVKKEKVFLESDKKDIKIFIISEKDYLLNFLSKIASNWSCEIFFLGEEDEISLIEEEAVEDKFLFIVEVESILKNRRLIDEILKSEKIIKNTVILSKDGEEIDLSEDRKMNILYNNLSEKNIVKFINSKYLDEKVDNRKKEFKLGENLEIFLIENNEINITILKKMAELMEFNLTHAVNGYDAMKILAKRKFDLILLDLQLPEIDGFQLSDLIRDENREQGIRTPIVAISAHSTEIVKEKIQKSQIDDFLPKPIFIEGLYEIMKKHLNRNIDLKEKAIKEEIKFSKEFLDKVIKDYNEKIEEIKKIIDLDEEIDLEDRFHELKNTLNVFRSEELNSKLDYLEYNKKLGKEIVLEILLKIEKELEKLIESF